MRITFLLDEEATIEYITKNYSFREILRKKLIGSSGFVEIQSLFKGSASYVETPSDYYDVVEINVILGSNGSEIIDYSKEIAITLDDQGIMKEGDPIFEIIVSDNALLCLAGTLIFAKNIYRTESVDLGSLSFEEIQYLVQNLDIKVKAMVTE